MSFWLFVIYCNLWNHIHISMYYRKWFIHQMSIKHKANDLAVLEICIKKSINLKKYFYFWIYFVPNKGQPKRMNYVHKYYFILLAFIKIHIFFFLLYWARLLNKNQYFFSELMFGNPSLLITKNLSISNNKTM